MTTKIDDEIIMKNNLIKNYNTCNRVCLPFKSYIRPHKRIFLDMIKNSNQTLLNNRIDNYKLCKKFEKKESKNNLNDNENKKDNLLIMNFNNFNDINKAKKNLMVKRMIEYDEEKERKLVENYYKIKNAELYKLRFGTD